MTLRPRRQDEPETGPLRRCIVTRERLPQGADDPLRARTRTARWSPTLPRLPGRGIWLSARGRCVRNRARPGTHWPAPSPGRPAVRSRCPPTLPFVLQDGLGPADRRASRARPARGPGGCRVPEGAGMAAGRPGRPGGAGVRRQRGGTDALVLGCGAGRGRAGLRPRSLAPRRWGGCSAATTWCMSRSRPGGWPRRWRSRRGGWPGSGRLMRRADG